MLNFFKNLFRPALPPVTSGNILYGDFPGYKTWFCSNEIPVEIGERVHAITNHRCDELSLESEALAARDAGQPLVPVTLKTPRGDLRGFCWHHSGCNGRDSIAALLTFGSVEDLLVQIAERKLLNHFEWEGKLYSITSSDWTQEHVVRAARPLTDRERRKPTEAEAELVWDVSYTRSM